MTDKELRELESLAVDQDRLFDPAAVITLIAEVRRLNRMVDRAIEKMSEFGCVTDSDPCPGNYIEVGCAECVRKYLESEVADNG